MLTQATRSSLPLAVLLAALACGAKAETLSSAAVAAFEKVCVPAAEGSVAPRDLAQAAGFSREQRSPPGLETMFPLAALSASFSVPTPSGELHIVSTVVPPPATPFSCALTVTGIAPDLSAQIEALARKRNYREKQRMAQDRASTVLYEQTVGNAFNRILLIMNSAPRAYDGGAVIVAFREER